MPNFADRKAEKAQAVATEPVKQAQAAAIHSIAGERPNAKTNKENARETFARINYNIQNGFKKLEDKINSLAVSGKNFSTGHNVFNYEYNTNRYISINKADKRGPEWRMPAPLSSRAGVIPPQSAPSSRAGAISAGATATRAPATIHHVESATRSPVDKAGNFQSQRVAHMPVTGVMQTPASGSQVSAIVTALSVAPAADQRAVHNFARGEAHKVEADATRMARVLEADKKIERGELPESPKVRNWAASIKEGRQREVADLDPKVVQNVLERLTGGPQGVKQLDTPKVSQIESEHKARAQTLQYGMESKRAAREAGNVETPKPREMSIRSVESVPSRNFPAGKAERPAEHRSTIQDHEMTTMLRNNDIAHSNAAVASIENMQSPVFDKPIASVESTAAVSMPPPTESQRVDPAVISSVPTTEKSRVGTVTSPGALRGAHSTPPVPSKSPWGTNRELSSIEGLMRDLINEVRKSGG